ncbi:hypothetical protein BJX76DRAFT_256756 [Aspergillus varians]
MLLRALVTEGSKCSGKCGVSMFSCEDFLVWAAIRRWCANRPVVLGDNASGDRTPSSSHLEMMDSRSFPPRTSSFLKIRLPCGRTGRDPRETKITIIAPEDVSMPSVPELSQRERSSCLLLFSYSPKPGAVIFLLF